MALVFVGLGFMGFFAATTLAIDIGMFMTARTQAQSAADAGALAGATALVFNSYTDRSPGGPVVQSAVNAARANGVMGGTPDDIESMVTPADVTFPVGPNGVANRVQVMVHRTGDRSNPIPTLVGAIFEVPWVSLRATATAEASPANGMTCVKPFLIPDKWTELGGTLGFNNGVDRYVPARDADGNDRDDYTGYTVANDVGSLIVLRAGTGDQVNPGVYWSWKMPGDTGGNFYRDNIANCNQSVITWDTQVVQEPGNMSGPTIQGLRELYAKDPNAYWDADCKCVKGSAFTGQSPRVFPIPLYDPQHYADGMATGRGASFKVANFLGFFLEGPISNNSASGRITTIIGTVTSSAGPAPAAAFPQAIRLVQ
jgi:hypothetical protein